jgi:hypothetical protein
MAGFDRGAGDPGNIVELGHVNLRVPDPLLATVFYISGLGLTRDPYMMTGIDNMWVNAGRTQFHLPTGAAQVLRGTIELAVPDIAALAARLDKVAAALAGTRFAVERAGEALDATRLDVTCLDVTRLDVTCPWGNRLRCTRAADPLMPLGISGVTFDVWRGTAGRIARFYRDVIGALAEDADGTARVRVGPGQTLTFRETDAAQAAAFDGHHVQVTLADFSGPHRRLLERGLVSREDDTYQYRFQDIVDTADGRVLFTVEHEVRSLLHPMFGRALVNRDPLQSNRHYRPGRDAFVPVDFAPR